MISIQPITPEHQAWIKRFLEDHWGSKLIVSRGYIHDGTTLPGFVVMLGEQKAGLITYHIQDGACEIVSIDSIVEGRGIGTALIDAVKQTAINAGCQRLWLITTNDNLPSLRFYQKRGFVLVTVHRNALAESRRIKPQIPLIGLDGIPLRDEIELEMSLDQP